MHFIIHTGRLESDVQELKADLQAKAEENKRFFLGLYTVRDDTYISLTMQGTITITV